jgi:nitrogen fixation-related uncharacterized protein
MNDGQDMLQMRENGSQFEDLQQHHHAVLLDAAAEDEREGW